MSDGIERGELEGWSTCRQAGVIVHSWRVLSVLLLVLGSVSVAPGTVAGHEPSELDDAYIQGVFSPEFTPPVAGTYDLPVIKRVSPFTLLDSAGRRVSTRAMMHRKVVVVSFIYTACSDRLGCPLPSVALREPAPAGRFRR